MEIRFGIKPIPIWILVGRWCPAAGGAAAPPYRGFGLLDEWRSDSSALPCRFGYWWGGGAPPLAERQLRPTGGLICWTNGGATVPPYRIWIVVGRRCPAAGGAAVPPYRGFGLLDEWRSDSSAYLADLDIGGAAVPRRWRSGSSALPGVWFVGRMAERQFRPTLPIWILVGRRCPPPAERQLRPTGGWVCWTNGGAAASALPDLDCGGAAVPRRRRNGSSAPPGVWFVGRMAERQLRPTGFGLWWGGGAPPPAERQLRPTGGLVCWTNGGAAAPPYLADLDIGRAAVPRRQRSDSSALPCRFGYW